MIRFLTYNVLDGGRGRERELSEILAGQDADVVVLQEVMDAGFVRDLAARPGMNWFVAESNSVRTVALLTRFRIQSAESYHPKILRHTCLHAVVEYAAGRTIDVFGVHLGAPAYTLPLELYRLLELNAILRLVGQVDGKKMVLAGDLNSIASGDTPDFKDLPLALRLSIFLQGGYVARQVVAYLRLRGFTDVYRMLNPNEKGYTLPAAKPNTRLDYIFVNEGLRTRVRRCRVVESPESVRTASDHLPVRMEMELAD